MNEAAVFWAMCYRMKPHKDVHIVGGMEKGHAPPFLYHHEEKGTDVVSYHLPADESAMLCNAILKEPFPPVPCPSASTWRMPRKSGKRWVYRSSDRRCPGSDTRSANGTKSWITKQSLRSKAATSKPARS